MSNAYYNSNMVSFLVTCTSYIFLSGVNSRSKHIKKIKPWQREIVQRAVLVSSLRKSKGNCPEAKRRYTHTWIYSDWSIKTFSCLRLHLTCLLVLQVLQRFGKTVESRDNVFDSWLQRVHDQQVTTHTPELVFHRMCSILLQIIKNKILKTRDERVCVFSSFPVWWDPDSQRSEALPGSSQRWTWTFLCLVHPYIYI